MTDQRYDMQGKPTKWPTEITCGYGSDGILPFPEACTEMAWITEDQGSGYVGYECPVHGAFAVQFDDSDEDFYDPDLDFGDEFDPWDEDLWSDDDEQ